MKGKVLAAMSGGVDSSVAALLLLQQGYEVIGVTARMFNNESIGLSGAKQPGSERDIEDARKVAAKLGIEHRVVDLCVCFKEKVIRHFAEEYQNGRTPNPCVDCNKHIKFGALWAYAQQLGCDYLATGHYARIFYDEASGRYVLARGEDRRKDQSYMLFSLNQQQLAHTLLPLADVSKDEIRALAESNGLVTAQKPESQDICFVPDGDYAALLERIGTKAQAGKFVHINGQVLGQHKGLTHYTIGQRKGLGLAYEYPLYVVAKDAGSGDVTLGPADALLSKALLAESCNFITIEGLTAPVRVTAKTRYRQQDVPATLEPCGEGLVKVVFDEPMRAVTPGQAVVFYSGENVVGGGIIRTALKE